MKISGVVASILIIVIIGAASVVIKVFINAGDELRIAEEAFAQKNFREARTHFERALRWYLPGSSKTDRAAAGMWGIAELYQAEKNFEEALNTYRLLRGGFYSVRSFYTPGKNWIEACNLKIAELMAGQPPSSPSEKTKSFEQRKTEALAILRAEKSPRHSWALATELGFFGWVACAFLFIFKGLTKTGSIRPRPAAVYGAAFVLFYGLWILGMVNV